MPTMMRHGSQRSHPERKRKLFAARKANLLQKLLNRHSRIQDEQSSKRSFSVSLGKKKRTSPLPKFKLLQSFKKKKNDNASTGTVSPSSSCCSNIPSGLSSSFSQDSSDACSEEEVKTKQVEEEVVPAAQTEDDSLRTYLWMPVVVTTVTTGVLVVVAMYSPYTAMALVIIIVVVASWFRYRDSIVVKLDWLNRNGSLKAECKTGRSSSGLEEDDAPGTVDVVGKCPDDPVASSTETTETPTTIEKSSLEPTKSDPSGLLVNKDLTLEEAQQGLQANPERRQVLLTVTKCMLLSNRPTDPHPVLNNLGKELLIARLKALPQVSRVNSRRLKECTTILELYQSIDSIVTYQSPKTSAEI